MTLSKGFLLVLILFSVLLSACSPTSRVVLLEGSKSNSAVVVTTEKGQLVLDEPNTYTVLSSAGKKPAAAKEINVEELQKDFGSLIHSAPKPPRSFLLYFEAGSTTLDRKSRNMFTEIKQAIRERAPCDVNIIGHADRNGSKEYNIKLSLKRAQKVYDRLTKSDLGIENIAVESYGEEDPLVPTPDGVAEPKNRRVEVLIR